MSIFNIKFRVLFFVYRVDISIVFEVLMLTKIVHARIL